MAMKFRLESVTNIEIYNKQYVGRAYPDTFMDYLIPFGQVVLDVGYLYILSFCVVAT